MEYLEVTFWALIGSVFSLLGGLLLVSNKNLRDIAVRYGLPFGAGALLAAAFIGVLPEAVEGSDIHQALLFALGGFLAFFLLERFVGWFHSHEDHHHDERSQTQQWLVIIGDTLHNAIDGVALGAAFLIDPALGIGTALAVAAHEIPQEIGDFSILLGKGMKPKRVVLVNLFSALATVVAALTTYALGDAFEFNPAPLLAVAAGFFVYIAASDIIPDIHEKPRREGDIQAVMLLFGVALIGSIIMLTPHSHGEADHSHDSHSHIEETHGNEDHEDGVHLDGSSHEHEHEDHDYHDHAH